MKFKTNFSKESVQKLGNVPYVHWSGAEEIYSCSTDRNLLKWTANTRESVQVASLPEDFHPTDLHLLVLKANVGGHGGKSADSLLIASNDGRFIIINKNARLERTISAHTGAITVARWSPDGSALLTAGEDGIVKIWSRTGMLRSTVIQNEGPIRCARWSPNSTAITYTQGSLMAIKPLVANSKMSKWKAHDGLVLCVAWANHSNLLVSGGEDCRYKVWDVQGSNLYTSFPDENPITSIDISPEGDLLAIGGFNMLKLCHYSGWSYSTCRFPQNVGSLYGLNWSPDGTQIVAGCGNGALLFGHIIDRQLMSRNLKATAVGRRTIILQDILTKTSDTLEFSDRVIRMALGYGHLLVTTPNQLHIFNENYINTPVIVDGRTDVHILSLGVKNFVAVDVSAIYIYTYTGRLHLTPKFPGSSTQMPNLTEKCISLGANVLAVRDFADQTVIYIFDLLPGATRQDEASVIRSKSPITEISVCRSGGMDNQYLVFIDTHRDLYIASLRSGAENFPIHKIGTQVLSVMWGSDANILVGLHDACYTIWYCPGEACTDPTLIGLTTLTYDSTEFGKSVTLESFEGCQIGLKSSGALFTISVKIYCNLLHKFVQDSLWSQAIKVCRLGQTPVLWATLAAMATKKNQLRISEEAYARALQIDKIHYLQHIENLPASCAEQMAEHSILNGRQTEAEICLLHNKKIDEAIALCIRMHNWSRALEIAEKHQTNLDFVLKERQKYLKALNKSEMDPKFLSIK
ncbi:intraflagellar transport protein 80 homolog [Lutzomyia longipalpis]|uniref:intraflagellar transport protein 80 homolog n=1 Tax=Lutzomyia longipalpis TaxID=7200 RepID=UPI002483C2AB|nr:intraflagellar transport protein 80 homolog [Lutzomyia longipalpis]